MNIEQSSDEETQQTEGKVTEKNIKVLCSTSKDLALSQNCQNIELYQRSSNFAQSSKNGHELINHSHGDVEQSESFIRDTILEQQSINEKKQAKRGDIHSIK